MRKSRRIAAAYAVSLAAVCTMVQTAGLFRRELTPGLAWTMIALGGALGIAFGIAIGRWLPAPVERPGRARPSRGASIAAWGVAAICLAFYALLWVPAYCRPDFTWDGMTYHLPTIHFWARRGYVHWITPVPEAGETWSIFTNGLLNGYPKTGELVGFILACISGGKLVTAANLVFLPLGVLGIVSIARDLGAPRAIAAAAGLLFVTVPTNVGQAASTYVDTAFCSTVIAFLALFFDMVRAILASPRARIPLPLVVAAGATLGLALGIKAPALGLTGVSVFALFVALAIRLRRRPRDRRRGIVATVLALSLMGAVALPIGGFWYARNWALTGNPMHPFEIKLAGRVVFPGQDFARVVPEEVNTPEPMKPWGYPRKIWYAWRQSGRLEWPIDGIVEHDEKGYALALQENVYPAWPRSIRYNDPRSGGLGFLWLYGGVPSLLVLLGTNIHRLRRGTPRARVRAARALIALGLLLAVMALYMKMLPMPWWARYTLWLHAAGLPALAYAVHETVTGLARRRVLAFVAAPMLAGLVGIAFFEYAYALKWDHTPAYFVGPPRAYSTSTWRELWRALTTSQDRGVSAIYFGLTETDLPRDAFAGNAVVAVGRLSTGNEPVRGQLSLPVGARNWIMMGPEVGTDPEAAERFVQKYVPRYVIWDHDVDGPPEVLMRTATRWTWFRTLMIFEFGPGGPSPEILRPK